MSDQAKGGCKRGPSVEKPNKKAKKAKPNKQSKKEKPKKRPKKECQLPSCKREVPWDTDSKYCDSCGYAMQVCKDLIEEAGGLRTSDEDDEGEGIC